MVAVVGKTSMWVAVASLGVERVQVAALPPNLSSGVNWGRKGLVRMWLRQMMESSQTKKWMRMRMTDHNDGP